MLDEPTAHLDAAGADAAIRSVVAAAGDRGVLVIAHGDAAPACFDEVLELRDGRLAPA